MAEPRYTSLNSLNEDHSFRNEGMEDEAERIP